jgi:hypothetical protein
MRLTGWFHAHRKLEFCSETSEEGINARKKHKYDGI